MKVIPPSSKTVVVGDKSFAQLEAEWKEWQPKRKRPEIPPNSVNATQYAEIHGITVGQALFRLNRGVKDGELARCMVNIPTPTGAARTYFFTRIKK